ncbi:C6 transcription factor [Pseudohyphozyma bogoriensis]|nr:C6 transcription factor [Pseudohyphozyma bogoriensis]
MQSPTNRPVAFQFPFMAASQPFAAAGSVPTSQTPNSPDTSNVGSHSDGASAVSSRDGDGEYRPSTSAWSAGRTAGRNTSPEHGDGTKLTEKCDRKWPKCARCVERGDECDYGNMVPVGALNELTEDGRVRQMERRIDQMELEMEDLKTQQDTSPAAFASNLRLAFLSGTQHSAEAYAFFGIDIHQGESGMSWRLAKTALSRALVLHLIDSFFVSCCAYLPVFAPYHSKLATIRDNIESLDAPTRVAVAGFCAMGARASPHSVGVLFNRTAELSIDLCLPKALLGIFVGDVKEWPLRPEVIEAGERREHACQKIQKNALDLCHSLGITETPTIPNLEALLVKTQMLIFDELVPRKSRNILRMAIGMFKDILDTEVPEEEKLAVVQRLGLPLFLADSITSSYARKPPLIVADDLESYFSRVNLHVDDFLTADLSELLDHYIPRSSTSGYVTHESLVNATTTLACWLACCQREFSILAMYRTVSTPLDVTKVFRLWAILDHIHDGMQRIQQILVNISYLPSGCESDGCADLHLRFDTRLDRDLMDVTYLLHGLVLQKCSQPTSFPQSSQNSVLMNESEKRVRKCLKLVAFYSQLYLTSQDHHMCYHLVWQLELLPNWTALACQRFGEVDGPRSQDLEVSETELDWFLKGLATASFFHPVARRRLREMQEWRRVARPEGGF